MALFDLSDVTRTLIWMLETRIPAFDSWPAGVTCSVSPLPPDRLVDAGTDLGLYLYHFGEDPAYKNPPPSASRPASRPLALNLFYQLTAQVGEQEGDAYRAQLLMGAALRVFHDFPLINDATTLVDPGGAEHNVLAQRGLQGRENIIRITLRPLPVDDAVDYWTAGDAPLRLAAYYQVSVVLLESEPPLRAAAPVLSYGTGIFVTGGPQVVGSRSNLSIVVGRDATASTVPVQPAQATLGERFELYGSALTGTSTTLSLRDGDAPIAVDPSSWAVVATPLAVYATVTDQLGGGTLVPGVYGASVQVSKTARVGGALRTVTHASNETPIVITPRLDAVSAVGPTLGAAAPGAMQVWTGWRFQSPDIPVQPNDPRSVRLYLGERLLSLRSSGVPDPGEYVIDDASTLTVHLPDDLIRGSLVPVRVGVRGAWSTPRWLEVA